MRSWTRIVNGKQNAEREAWTASGEWFVNTSTASRNRVRMMHSERVPRMGRFVVPPSPLYLAAAVSCASWRGYSARLEKRRFMSVEDVRQCISVRARIVMDMLREPSKRR